VNSLSARCGALTVCQCQRDKEEEGEEGEEEKKKRRRKAGKPANEGVGPVFGYQAFYFYSHGRQNAKLSPSRFGVRKIYFHAREGKHEFR